MSFDDDIPKYIWSKRVCIVSNNFPAVRRTQPSIKRQKFQWLRGKQQQHNDEWNVWLSTKAMLGAGIEWYTSSWFCSSWKKPGCPSFFFQMGHASFASERILWIKKILGMDRISHRTEIQPTDIRLWCWVGYRICQTSDQMPDVHQIFGLISGIRPCRKLNLISGQSGYLIQSIPA